MDEGTYGLHLLLRISDVREKSALDDLHVIARYLVALVDRIGMRILSGPLVGREEGPPEKLGCSGVIILYESHVAIHTYPSLGQAFIDIFSCRSFEISHVVETTCAYFGPHRIVEQCLLERGIHWSTDIHKEFRAWHADR